MDKGQCETTFCYEETERIIEVGPKWYYYCFNCWLAISSWRMDREERKLKEKV